MTRNFAPKLTRSLTSLSWSRTRTSTTSTTPITRWKSWQRSARPRTRNASRRCAALPTSRRSTSMRLFFLLWYRYYLFFNVFFVFLMIFCEDFIKLNQMQMLCGFAPDPSRDKSIPVVGMNTQLILFVPSYLESWTLDMTSSKFLAAVNGLQCLRLAPQPQPFLHLEQPF